MELSKDKIDVLNYIENNDNNLFITGRAGSGKTILLKEIAKRTAGRSAIIAPTGVAALNAGGSTIHSFLKLPLSPYKPMFRRKQSMSMLSRYSLTEEDVDVVKQLDILIIDEISMVRSDLMDAINDALCFYRETKEPFGGVQLIMVGDIFQLPPVVIQDEWATVKDYYDSPFFYDSHALKISGFETFNLTSVFRQTENDMIDMLDLIRYGDVSRDDIKEINKMYKPHVSLDNDWVTLTSTNYEADTINRNQMRALGGEEKVFDTIISGNFNPKDGTFLEKLNLKPGAQVMMLVNDTDGHYVNGTIGTYIRTIPHTLNPGDDLLEIDIDGNLVWVDRFKWSKYEYAVNPTTGIIESRETGTAEQYPLKPAWAITIHKSQGLTFDKLAIKAGEAFAHGQVYVALSRGRTIDGTVLLERIKPRNIVCDERLSLFAKSLGI